MIKNVIKILSLVLCVLLQVHLSLFTVGNIINPVTLMYFLYYSHPFSNWEIGWFPYLFIFTFNSIISYYLLRLIFKDVNLRKYLIAYTICDHGDGSTDHFSANRSRGRNRPPDPKVRKNREKCIT